MNEKTKIFLIPGAIIIASVVIAAAVLVSGGVISIKSQPSQPSQPSQAADSLSALKGLKPVDAKDHVLGNASAKVKIVEFSDMDCPYCKRFNATIDELLTTYGDKIAVVYRHFPLTALHPNAKTEAEATECAAKLAGNEGFWTYFKKYEAEIAGGESFSNDLLLSTAESAGINRADFAACLQSDEPSELVKEDADNATKIGVTGTPFSVILLNGKPVDTIEGAYPIEAVKAKLDQYVK
ncbi:MAG: DsbA family protein [Patescibacteria group bacterium]|nr:DsbA family protein [Patescibacteria group bacterium]MCL5262110.1 DsbA family protein [Patescibacteria group bacterium]